jgi:hypothetical protein
MPSLLAAWEYNLYPKRTHEYGYRLHRGMLRIFANDRHGDSGEEKRNSRPRPNEEHNWNVSFVI